MFYFYNVWCRSPTPFTIYTQYPIYPNLIKNWFECEKIFRNIPYFLIYRITQYAVFCNIFQYTIYYIRQDARQSLYDLAEPAPQRTSGWSIPDSALSKILSRLFCLKGMSGQAKLVGLEVVRMAAPFFLCAKMPKIHSETYCYAIKTKL